MFICQVENINERKIQIVNHIKLQTSKVICVLKRSQREKQEVIFRGVPKQLLPCRAERAAPAHAQKPSTCHPQRVSPAHTEALVHNR